MQIDRVVSNLLENAIRFAPPGSTIDISARADALRAEMTVAVANQGPAIPERVRPHLFDKFYRVSEDRLPGMGTGLGLSICKGIVEAHGGHGYEVVSAADGEEALDKAASESPDAVILDLNLPRLSGLRCARLCASGRPFRSSCFRCAMPSATK